jgi:hypothetical protein
MRIQVTIEEIEALCFAEDQISTLMESADDDYSHDASIQLYHLRRIICKFRDAEARQKVRSQFYRLAKKLYPKEGPEKWRKIASMACTKKQS